MTERELSNFEGMDLVPQRSEDGDLPAFSGRVRLENMTVPTLKLLQGMSDECTNGAHPDARPGLFFLSVANIVMHAPLRVIPITYTFSRKMTPKDTDPDYERLGATEVCRSWNGDTGDIHGNCSSCQFKQFRPNPRNPRRKRRPMCDESHNFAVLTQFGPAWMYFGGTSAQAGGNLVQTAGLLRKNLYDHPLVIDAESRNFDQPNGKKVNYFRMVPRWVQAEETPNWMREQAAHMEKLMQDEWDRRAEQSEVEPGEEGDGLV